MSENTDKIILFEQTPIPKAVVKLAVPTILSSLVMVLYNLADTYFVGMCNDPIQNAAVTLAAPVLLAFNAVTNLFGIGSSSMMSRALGRKDYDTVYKSSALGFYCAAVSGVLFALACLVFKIPLLRMLGANADTMAATGEYLKWTSIYGAVPAILNVVKSGRRSPACQSGNNERLFFEYYSGSYFHTSMGVGYGSRRCRTCYIFI